MPVADVAVTLAGFFEYCGEAMAMGERTQLALIDPAASGRMAVGEVITNIMAAPVAAIGDIKLSANWMAAAGHPAKTRRSTTRCARSAWNCARYWHQHPGRQGFVVDEATWSDGGAEKAVTAPLSLIVSAFAPVTDARKTLTPQLKLDGGDTALVLIDLGAGKNRLGGSALAQVYGQVGSAAPDLDAPRQLVQWFDTVQKLNREGRILAYHDRSDGGCSSRCADGVLRRAGLAIKLPRKTRSPNCSTRTWRRPQVRTADPPPCAPRSPGRPAGEFVEIASRSPAYHQHRTWRAEISARRARSCTASGRQPRFSCKACATIRRARARNTTAARCGRSG